MYVADRGANLTYPQAQGFLLSWDSDVDSRSVSPRISEAREGKRWREGGGKWAGLRWRELGGKGGLGFSQLPYAITRKETTLAMNDLSKGWMKQETCALHDADLARVDTNRYSCVARWAVTSPVEMGPEMSSEKETCQRGHSFSSISLSLSLLLSRKLCNFYTVTEEIIWLIKP